MDQIKKYFIQFLKVAVPVGLGIYLVIHIYQQLDAAQRAALFTAVKEANYLWVSLSFGMGLLSHYIRGYRWGFQLQAMGYESSTRNNFLAVLLGYIVNMVLPRVGEVSRAAAITKYDGIPFEKSFGSIISERALDFLVLMAITGTTVLLQYNLLISFFEKTIEGIHGKAASTVLWVLLALGLMGAVLAWHLLDRYKARPWVYKLWQLREGLVEGLRSILRMKDRGKYLLATLAIWMLYVAMFWVVFFAVEETATLGPNAVFAAFVIGSFAIVVIPGGIGAFPVGIMQALALYGIAAETGFALGWILWLSQTAMIVLAGGLSMYLLPQLNKKSKSVQHVHT